MITFSRLGYYGQLGNQLFQTAMLIGISEKLGYTPIIPHRPYGYPKEEGLVELGPFSLTLSTGFFLAFNKYIEPDLEFSEDVWKQPDGTDFEGYYQNERYFLHAEDRIRREFKIQREYTSCAEDLMRRIRRKGNCVVGVHVRRGNNLKHPHLYYVLPREWYIREMNSPFLPKEKQFLIVSDDPDWCYRNLGHGTGFNVHVCRTQSYILDLAMLTLCHAHILSSSSFGWWGAWLAKESCRVSVPYPWYPKTSHLRCEGIIPSSWIKVPVEEE